MSVSIVLSSTVSNFLFFLKKSYLFFKKNINCILLFLLLISVSLNVILFSHYPTDYETNKLVNEYKNNGLETAQIDCSNFRTPQAQRAKMLSALIIANSKYTSNPQKYLDDVEYTSGTSFLDCNNK